MTQTTTPQAAKEEMWLIILAKSKTMRFFAVSCEFILFLGCLWLTMTTILPSATGWLSGGVDNFFLIAMGFAVDAAMPEAWLHVADQFTDTPKKTTQLWWSIPIAVGMSLLVVANVVYTKLVGTSGANPTGAMEAIVNTLLIARILIGISYVSIREGQSFLDRKQAKQQPPAPPAVDIQQIVTQAIADLDQRLASIVSEQAQMVATIRQMQNTSATIPTIDTNAIVETVLIASETRFAVEMQRSMQQLKSFMQQQVSITVEREARQLTQAKQAGATTTELHENAPAQHNNSQSSRLVPFPQRPGIEDTRTRILRIYNEDTSRSDQQIADMLGVNKTTVWRYLKAVKEAEAIDAEASETATIDSVS